MTDLLDEAAERARRWLFGAALPLWLDAGWDKANGGFFDKLDQRGEPVAMDKRVRVQARQIYCYAQAGALGWDGPWRPAVERGVTLMLDAYRRGDGLFRRSVTPNGAPSDESADLYDQAFVLFALAAAHTALDRPARLEDEATSLLGRLTEAAAHPDGGFRELSPALLRSNPHMHMLEALLAWVEAAPHIDPVFAGTARTIVDLAMRRFIDPATGAIGEYFSDDWSRAPGMDGQIREPGHQFEWAYLLGEADRLLGGNHKATSDRLYAFGDRHGISADGRAIFSTDPIGAPLDRSSRLWAQTERLRAALVLYPGDAAATTAALDSLDWIWRSLDVPVSGLWLDRVSEAGSTIDEPSPASSLYHIVTGFVPLIARPAGDERIEAGRRH